MPKHGLAGSAYADGTRVSAHRMRRVHLATGATVAEFSATGTPPWQSKPVRRAKNKAARQSRKKNR